MFEEKDIPYYQIMDAFLERYTQESEEIRQKLDKLDDMAYREAVSKLFPSASRFLESHTRAELEVKLMIVAIASSVAEAIVEANRILH